MVPVLVMYRSRARAMFALCGIVLGCALGFKVISAGVEVEKERGQELAQPWRTGRPVAIAVRDGAARFSLATPKPNGRTLVIVSALTPSDDPFPIQVNARRIAPSAVEPPAVEAGPIAHAARCVPVALPPIREPSKTLPPPERTFYLMVRDGDVASPSNYQAVRGRLKAVGRRVQVYVDSADEAAGKGSAAVLRSIVTTFDDAILPVAARSIGQARDVDGDGRFTVLLSSWLSRLAAGRHAVDGFVRGADLDLELAAPFSNHCDMLYLSATLDDGPHLRTVLAHEYAHAVTFSAKSLGDAGRPAGPEEEGWLDEAIAHLAEDQHGYSRSNIDYRVSAFLARPERYRLVVEDYYASDLFRSHGNRGATYLFLRWCVDRFGPGLVPVLVHSEKRGVANLEAATGARFEDLYRAWSLALFFSGFEEPAGNPPNSGKPDVPRVDFGGPRSVAVSPGTPGLSWLAGGTTSRYLLVGASDTGAIDVEVRAPAEAGLQVTAVALPDDLASLDLSARITSDPAGTPRCALVLKEAGGTKVQLSALSWEPLVPGPNPHSAPSLRVGLDTPGIAALLGSSELPGLGTLASEPMDAMPVLPWDTLLFRAIGRDAHGRRVAAWAEIPGRFATIEGSKVTLDRFTRGFSSVKPN